MKGTIACLTVVTLLTVARAEAQALARSAGFLNQCSTGAIKTCASFQTEAYRYLSATGWRTQIYIRVRNLYTVLADGRLGGSTLTRLGVLMPKDLLDERYENALTTGDNRGGTAPVFTELGATSSGNPLLAWAMGRGNLNSLGRLEFGASTSNPVGGVNDCIGPASRQTPSGKNSTPTFYRTCVNDAPAGWTTFAFTSASEIRPVDMQLAWGVVSVQDPQRPGRDMGSYQGETCIGCGSTDVVPEPVTMLLLGSGLLGIGGASRWRRRKPSPTVLDGEIDAV